MDPLDSTSRLLDPEYISLEHYKTTRDTQKLLQDYKSLQDIIAILGAWPACRHACLGLGCTVPCRAVRLRCAALSAVSCLVFL